VWIAASRGVFVVGAHEDRYVAVGQYVDRAMPPNAVLLAAQQSGSLRYYTGRLTVRYDSFEVLRLASAIEWLRARGYRPYIVLDSSEEQIFRERFNSQGPIGRLQLRVVAEMTEPVLVRIYDPLEPMEVEGEPFTIRPRRRRACVPPHPLWAAPKK
jgi:hypothetical protein